MSDHEPDTDEDQTERAHQRRADEEPSQQSDAGSPAQIRRAEQLPESGVGVERTVDGDKWRARLEQLKDDLEAAETDGEKEALAEKVEDLRSRMADAGVLIEETSEEPDTGSDVPAEAGPARGRPGEPEADVGERENSERTTSDGGSPPGSPGGSEALSSERGHDAGSEGSETSEPVAVDPDDGSGLEDGRQQSRHSDQTASNGVADAAAGASRSDAETETALSGGTRSEPEAGQQPPTTPRDEHGLSRDADIEQTSPDDGSPRPARTAESSTTKNEAAGGKAAGREPATDDRDSRMDSEPQTQPRGESEPDSETAAVEETDASVEAEPNNQTEDMPPQEAARTDTATPEAVLSDKADASDDSEPLPGAVSELHHRIESLETTVEEYQRKNEREHDILRKEAVEQLGERMLRVRETLLRALEYTDWDGEQAAMLDAVVKKFDQQLTAGAIEKIDPDRGDEVDHLRHALAGPREDATDVDPGCIVRIERPGFEFDGYPLQEAQVIAAKRE